MHCDCSSGFKMSFLIRARADRLPAPLNLKRWKFKVESKCSLCCQNLFPTTFHILSGCSTSLEQGRFTWRHDSVLLHLTGKVPPSISMYADLNGPATLPLDLSVSSCRPDLVITENDSVYILELTIPANSLESLNKCPSTENPEIIIRPPPWRFRTAWH